MTDPSPPIDLDKLRRALRCLGDETMFLVLDDLLDDLPPPVLQRLAARWLRHIDLRPDPGPPPTLLDRVRAFDAAARHDPRATRPAFDILFALLHHVDECHDDIVSWSDEGGVQTLDIDWRNVLPAWFACLAATAEPDEFASLALDTVGAFDCGGRGRHEVTALAAGNAAQRAALTRRLKPR